MSSLLKLLAVLAVLASLSSAAECGSSCSSQQEETSLLQVSKAVELRSQRSSLVAEVAPTEAPTEDADAGIGDDTADAVSEVSAANKQVAEKASDEKAATMQANVDNYAAGAAAVAKARAQADAARTAAAAQTASMHKARAAKVAEAAAQAATHEAKAAKAAVAAKEASKANADAAEKSATAKAAAAQNASEAVKKAEEKTIAAKKAAAKKQTEEEAAKALAAAKEAAKKATASRHSAGKDAEAAKAAAKKMKNATNEAKTAVAKSNSATKVSNIANHAAGQKSGAAQKSLAKKATGDEISLLHIKVDVAQAQKGMVQGIIADGQSLDAIQCGETKTVDGRLMSGYENFRCYGQAKLKMPPSDVMPLLWRHVSIDQVPSDAEERVCKESYRFWNLDPDEIIDKEVTVECMRKEEKTFDFGDKALKASCECSEPRDCEIDCEMHGQEQ